MVTDTAGPQYDLETETLAGDVRDVMLGTLRDLKRPWSMLTEDEKRGVAERFERAANHMVQQSMTLIADYDFPKCAIQLGEIKIVGGDKARIEAKIAAANIEENRNTLGDHAGGRAMLLMVDPEIFMGERAEVEIEPDQMSLPGDEEK